MSIYAKAFASYLARTFHPVTVTFTSIPLKYENPLFTISHQITSRFLTDNNLTDNNYGSKYIEFDYAINKYRKNRFYNNNKLNTPESFIKHMLDKPNDYTTFKLKQIDYDKKLMQFNTNGMIPLRYLDINNDFTLNQLKYEKPTEVQFQIYEKELLEKIVHFKDKELLDIYEYAEYLSTKENVFCIEIKKAPSYTYDKDFINKYYKNSYRKPISYDNALQFIKDRYWDSGDGDMSSPSTKIFFERSKNLKSLNYKGYNMLFSASGGIDMSYASDMPWFKLKRIMCDQQRYYDMYSRYIYLSYGIGITEFIIFSEALASEGVIYTLQKQ